MVPGTRGEKQKGRQGKDQEAAKRTRRRIGVGLLLTVIGGVVLTERDSIRRMIIPDTYTVEASIISHPTLAVPGYPGYERIDPKVAEIYFQFIARGTFPDGSVQSLTSKVAISVVPSPMGANYRPLVNGFFVASADASSVNTALNPLITQTDPEMNWNLPQNNNKPPLLDDDRKYEAMWRLVLLSAPEDRKNKNGFVFSSWPVVDATIFQASDQLGGGIDHVIYCRSNPPAL